jgi:hypothetical protein
MNKKYTINFEPLPEGGLRVTVPEIGATVQTSGTTLRDAEAAAIRLIDEHLQKTRKPRAHRPRTQRPRASSNNGPEKYTIHMQPVGDHLQVTIAEIGVTVETAPGKIKREDAERAATRAISEYALAQREATQVKQVIIVTGRGIVQ